MAQDRSVFCGLSEIYSAVLIRYSESTLASEGAIGQNSRPVYFC
jgi:hypothetical protein